MNLLLSLLVILLLLNVCVSFCGSSVEAKDPNFRNVRKSLRRYLLDASPSTNNEQIIKNNKYFQDIFVEHSSPLKIEFGHVFENPKEWEQRYERNDLENKRFQGKVLWGNQDGNYGEQYWDLNH